MVWAFSTVGEAHRHPRFLSAAAAAATRAGPAAFKPHELSALAWGYGKAGLAHRLHAHRHEPLLEVCMCSHPYPLQCFTLLTPT